jgi:glycosyltransferase involved in cell wall biosynthesis
VQDGVSGILVPADNPAELAAAILRLLRDPSMAAAMGASGRAIVAENFTDEAMMRRIVRTYQGLLGDR